MLDWTEDLLVGVDKIDNQHKELFERINSMLTAMKTGKGKFEVITALNFLEEYVVKHFSEEEEIQKKSNYPKLSIQRVQHQLFKDELKELRETFEKQGTSAALVIQTQQKMTTWWRSHIMQMDKDLGNHLSLISK